MVAHFILENNRSDDQGQGLSREPFLFPEPRYTPRDEVRMILDNLRHDLELTWRGLRRAKAFSAAAILTLGLGIAGTTVMFTLIQGVLLRPLPVREQDRLIVAWKELRSSGFTHHHFGDAAIDAVGRASQLLEQVAGVDANGVGHGVISDGASGDVKVALVTGAFFEVLGVEPILGRPLTPADDVDGAEKVVVISHGLWQRRYGGSRDVIGRRDYAQRAAVCRSRRHATRSRLSERCRGVADDALGVGGRSLRRCRAARG